MNIESFGSDIGHKFQGSGHTPLQKHWEVPLASPLGDWMHKATRQSAHLFIL